MRTYTITMCMLLWGLVNSSAQEYKLYTPLEIQKVYENKTRSPDGKPGQKYWQNRSEYTISAEIDTVNHALIGTEEVTYFNNSPDTLKQIVLRLYQDLYRFGNSRDYDVPKADLSDGTNITYLAINDKEVPNIDDFERYWTIMIVPLSENLNPGENLRLSIRWNYRFPSEFLMKGAGKYNDDTYFVAHWYPQVAVYDDISGWDEYPYKGIIEFYHDFSDYDVRIKVPYEFIVWSTGVLQNPHEILAKKYLNRYTKALESDETVSVIGSDDRKAGGITIKDETNTWHYKAENIPDFVFGTSGGYLWDATSLVVDKKTGRRVGINAAYKSDSEPYYEAAELCRRTIAYLSNELPGVPYPFPSMTAFDGTSAMEYPMMVNVKVYRPAGLFIFTLIHEITHSYFPFYMGTNERKYAFMDEGWAQMLPMALQTREIEKQREGFDARVKNNRDYEESAGRERYDKPPAVLSVNTDYYTNHNAYYDRPGTAYYFLQDLLGEQLFKAALQEFMSRWHHKHPMPYDFYNTFDEVTGEDLSWYWKPWFFEFGYPDLAIKEFKETSGKKTFVIERRGNIPIPIDLKLTYVDMSIETIYRTARAWEKGNTTFPIDLNTDKKIKTIELGNRIIPDVDKSNNILHVKSEDDTQRDDARRDVNSRLFDELGIEFVRVAGGSFQMGDTFGDGGKYELPVHAATLDEFSLSKTEVTFAQYDSFCEATGREKPDDEGFGRGNRPVINVSWNDATAFCQWLSYKSGQEIHLPTEAEWEYAAREGGKQVRFGNGQDTADPSEINFNGSEENKKPYSQTGVNRQKTVPVASFSPNALGLYDMSGNVWEWCADWYEREYYRNSPQKNPKGADAGTYRSMRGGSWNDGPGWLRCVTRGVYTPTSRTNFIGFRVARMK